MFLLFLTWKHDDCFIPQLGQHLQSSKTPDLKPEDKDERTSTGLRWFSEVYYDLGLDVRKPVFGSL